MLNIKCFEDGGRLVVVLEGIDIPSAEEMVKKFFAGIMSGAVEAVSPGEATPIPTLSVEEEVLPTFEEGPYTGKTPYEVLENEEDANNAFKWIVGQIKKNSLKGKLLSASQDALEKYLKIRFESCEPDEYSKKLTTKQLEIFFERHNEAISSRVKDYIMKLYQLKNWDEISSMEESKKRELLADLLHIVKG